MMVLKSEPTTRTIKKDKVIGFYLHNKKKFEERKKIENLLNDVLRHIE